MREILDEFENVDQLKAEVKTRYHELIPIHITIEDIMASINYIYAFGFWIPVMLTISTTSETDV